MALEVVPALVAGLVGTVVMSAMMRMARSAGMTEMPPMHIVTGSMMSGDPMVAARTGIVIHYGLMGTVAFGLGYAAHFAAFGTASAGTGALLGFVHGAGLGLVVLPMMSTVHPRMTASRGAAALTVDGDGISLTAPGLLGSRWGTMTPVGIVAGHVVYGVVVALVYTWLS